jgi:hypothetical protein
MLRRGLSVRFSRRAWAVTAATGAAAMVLGVTAAAVAATGSNASSARSFSFALKRSPGIVAAGCLRHAGGRVTITPHGINDTMRVFIHGLPRGASFDLFVIQTPNKPFGVSWYQSDVNVGRHGTGRATVRGVFDRETFSVSPGGTTTFAPTHQFHLGLWFNNPRTPFRLGCEPGAPAPVVTPFNGRQHAGIQVLNTAQFPDNAGPLSHVHR